MQKQPDNPLPTLQVVCTHKEPTFSFTNGIATGQLVLLALSAIWVYKQLQKLSQQVEAAQSQIRATQEQMLATYEWNKRAKAFTALEKHKDNIEYSKKIREIEESDTKEKPKGTLPDRENLFETNREYRTSRLVILNDMESLAIEIKHGMCDEEIAYDLIRSVVSAQWNEMKSTIIKRRVTKNTPKLFIEFEILANKWDEKYRLEQSSAAGAMRTTPRPGIVCGK